MNQFRLETHTGGWPRIYPYDTFRRRVIEAWWVLTDKWSLHRAWQNGYDQHIMDESARRARTDTALQHGATTMTCPDCGCLPTDAHAPECQYEQGEKS